MANHTVGPITVGENEPMAPKPSGISEREGMAMSPGGMEKPKFSPRTPAKFRGFKREQVPHTPGGNE